MSFSLAIENGDLRTNGSALGTVYGIDKLSQDLSLWLRERYQSDRFHMNYGSTLDSYIGLIISERSANQIRSEVLRVLHNYQSLQYRRIKERPDAIASDEILLEILEIRVRSTYDRIDVGLRLSTGDRREKALTISTNI